MGKLRHTYSATVWSSYNWQTWKWIHSLPFRWFLLEPVKGRDKVPSEIAFCAIGIYRKPGIKLGPYQQITVFISRLWLQGLDTPECEIKIYQLLCPFLAPVALQKVHLSHSALLEAINFWLLAQIYHRPIHSQPAEHLCHHQPSP